MRLRKSPMYMTDRELQSELERLREKEIRIGWLSKNDQRLAISLIGEANTRNGSRFIR